MEPTAIPGRPASELPSALRLVPGVLSPDRPLFLFFDFDGTLAPIAPTPDMAELTPEVRDAVVRLAERWPVAIVSGRDLADIQRLVGLTGLVYAGCHGLEISGPDDWRESRGTEASDALDEAERSIRDATMTILGVVVERKRLGLAVHYREVAAGRIPEIERIVTRVADGSPDLRLGFGKAVFELRPNVAWNKGDAVRRILEVIDPAGIRAPIYVGDDVTDEDAFAEVVDHPGGVAVAVGLGSRATVASHRLEDPDEVVAFMRELAAI